MKFGIGIITTGNRDIHPGVLNHLTMPTTVHIHRINQDVFEKAIYQTRQMYRPYIN